MPDHGEFDQLAGIHKMLRPEMLGRPAASILKLYSEEMAAIAKHAVAHDADELPITIVDADLSTWEHGALHLKAYSR